MDFAKFEALWQALMAWIYDVLEYFGMDAADGDGDGITGIEE